MSTYSRQYYVNCSCVNVPTDAYDIAIIGSSADNVELFCVSVELNTELPRERASH